MAVEPERGGELNVARQTPVDQGAAAEAVLAVPSALAETAALGSFSAATMARTLRVLFVASRPTNSSAASVHANLMRFLNRDRVEVHVLYNRLAGEEPYASSGTSLLDVLSPIPGLHLRPGEFGPVGGGTPKLALLAATARSTGPATLDTARMVNYIRRQAIDVIHCEEGTRDVFYGLALSRLTPAKCIGHLHVKFASWMSPASQYGMRHADAVITVSRWGGEVARAAGVPADRIFPVLNGIDVSTIHSADSDATAVRREFGLAPEDPLVVTVAQLAYFKRQDVLIEAFRAVVDEHPNARLLIVGRESHPAPTHGAASYTDYLRECVAAAGLAEHVTFTGHRRDVRAILSAADVFAMPSIEEPFGLTHVEAMAMGNPVVAVDSGGIREIVDHGHTGLLGPPDDATQLAANLNTLIDAPDRRREMATAGRNRVHELFTAQRMADGVEAVYRRVAFGAP
jgi:glycosyltransferase involved in cell wall biosynthesis